MVTFRKDIHLGRRVPIRPEDEDECMLVSISENGLAVDKYGRKWRFLPWGDILAVPVITLADVTEEEFPTLVGKREAMWLITLTHEDSEAEIWYKVVKNGDEPEAYSKYVEPILIKENGIYQIVAKAKKVGVANSEIVRSDSFKVTRVAIGETYSEISVPEFYYDKVPCTQGTAKPHLRYQQTGSRTYTDGTTESITPVTSGAILNFSRLGAIDALTGDIQFDAWNWKNEHLLDVVTLTITLNGKTATKTASVYQLGKENKPKNIIRWTNGKNPDGKHYPQGTTLTAGVDFEAYTNDGATITYYYEKGNQKIEIHDTVTIDQDTIIGAHAAETESYDETDNNRYVYIQEKVYAYVGWGISDTELSSIVTSGDGADLVFGSNYPHVSVTRSGDISAHIENQGVSNGALWIATNGLNNLQVTIKQSGFPITIEGNDLDDFSPDITTFDAGGGVIYYAQRVILEENADLVSVTFTPNT